MTNTPADPRRGESFDDALFDGLELADVDLGGKVFANCSFRNLKLPQSRWARARLEDCVFEACDLTRLEPAGLVLRGVAFKRCKMMGIDWTDLGAYPDLGFEDCNLSYCSFVSFRARKTPFVRCLLTETSFLGADLVEARFEECQLGGARFERCDLRKASFGGSSDLLLDPAANQVRGAVIPPEAALLLAASFGLKIADR